MMDVKDGRIRGVLIFQEQILRLAREIAGLSWAQADQLRRGMSHFGAQAPFSGLRDLLTRVALRPKEIDHLIRGGALDSLAESRAALLAEVREMGHDPGGQMAFDFGWPNVPAETLRQRWDWEAELLGLPVSAFADPLALTRHNLPAHVSLPELRPSRVPGKARQSGSWGHGSDQLFIWDTQSWSRVAVINDPSEGVYGVAWSADGERLVSAGSDGMLRWWNPQNGQCILSRQGHEGPVQSLRASPDGRLLASCGDDGAIQIWQMESGEHVETLRRDRPYERLNITGIKGLTDAQKHARDRTVCHPPRTPAPPAGSGRSLRTTMERRTPPPGCRGRACLLHPPSR